MTEPLLSVRELSVDHGAIRAVHTISLDVAAGEVVAILGPNGAGKTTLLQTLAGLLAPTAGSVRLDGEDVTGGRAERLVAAGIALVPEGRGVFADLSVLDNLVLGAYHRRRSRSSADLDDVLELFEPLRARARQRAGTLSGGEQQMLAIGRALMARPRLLLLDEPLLGLAPLAVQQVLDRVGVLRVRGCTVLLVEQNTRAALRVASRGYLLERGRVAHAGRAAELLDAQRVKDAYLGPVTPS
jgi:branched-chain amino acid transport system ATP-binding protein